ncbi:MAG: class beta-lactamase-related serine hydrolase, partial [Bacteroidota bacterium]|nr:class beta-lactamase-related serine hydrolase [Bacteroidota bacterium]
RNGSWKGKQIIPGDWVKITTSVVTSHQEAVDNKTAVNHFAYGYLWWIWDKPYSNGAYEGAYTAIGAYGQFITVIPKLDIVVAFKTKSTYERATSPDRFLQVLDKLIACRENRE